MEFGGESVNVATVRSIVALLFLISTGAAWSSLVDAQVPSIPANLLADVARSEELGTLLFRAFTSPSSSDPLLERASRKAEQANVEGCGAYRSVVIPPQQPEPASILVYLIVDRPISDGIVLGRHFRIEVSGDGERILAAAASTESCMNVRARPRPRVPAEAEFLGALVSHILSPSPTEFHVFLSLLHEKPIYVHTKSGRWKVEAGKISYIKFYGVAFGVVIGENRELQSFRVVGVTDPDSGSVAFVNINIPDAYVAAARALIVARGHHPTIEGGKPREMFTYFFFDPARPNRADADPRRWWMP